MTTSMTTTVTAGLPHPHAIRIIMACATVNPSCPLCVSGDRFCVQGFPNNPS